MANLLVGGLSLLSAIESKVGSIFNIGHTSTQNAVAQTTAAPSAPTSNPPAANPPAPAPVVQTTPKATPQATPVPAATSANKPAPQSVVNPTPSANPPANTEPSQSNNHSPQASDGPQASDSPSNDPENTSNGDSQPSQTTNLINPIASPGAKSSGTSKGGSLVNSLAVGSGSGSGSGSGATGTSVPSSIGTLDPNQSGTQQSSSSQGLSSGTKAGIAVGVILGLIVLGVLFFFIFAAWRRRRLRDGVVSLTDSDDYARLNLTRESAAPAMTEAPVNDATASRTYAPYVPVPAPAVQQVANLNRNSNPFDDTNRVVSGQGLDAVEEESNRPVSPVSSVSAAYPSSMAMVNGNSISPVATPAPPNPPLPASLVARGPPAPAPVRSIPRKPIQILGSEASIASTKSQGDRRSRVSRQSHQFPGPQMSATAGPAPADDPFGGWSPRYYSTGGNSFS